MHRFQETNKQKYIFKCFVVPKESLNLTSIEIIFVQYQTNALVIEEHDVNFVRTLVAKMQDLKSQLIVFIPG